MIKKILIIVHLYFIVVFCLLIGGFCLFLGSDKSFDFGDDTTISDSGGILMCPLEKGVFVITSPFGRRVDPVTGRLGMHHNGIDMACPTGTPIYSAEKGVVVDTGYSPYGYGNYAIISHGKNLYTLYGHCSKILVRSGQEVKRGQKIALVGSTGKSTGSHLHFEVRSGGNDYSNGVNPMKYLK